MATQKERILYDLVNPIGCVGRFPNAADEDAANMCAVGWLEQRMPRYAARINELRNEGHRIETVGTCRVHKTAVYRLVQEPEQLTL